jgi:hypothetical protein
MGCEEVGGGRAWLEVTANDGGRRWRLWRADLIRANFLTETEMRSSLTVWARIFATYAPFVNLSAVRCCLKLKSLLSFNKIPKKKIVQPGIVNPTPECTPLRLQTIG